MGLHTQTSQGAHADLCPVPKAPTIDASELDQEAMEESGLSDESYFLLVTWIARYVCVTYLRDTSHKNQNVKMEMANNLRFYND